MMGTKSSPGYKRVEGHRNTAKNMLRRSRKPQVQSKPSNKLWFATKSSPGHERVEVHKDSPPKHAQWVDEPPKCTQI